MAQHIGSDIAIIGAAGNAGRLCVQEILERNLISPRRLRVEKKYVNKQIAFNVIAQIDEIVAHGFTFYKVSGYACA